MDFSNFGRFLTRGSGIVQLMEDFGDAHAFDGEVFMLGGGNPGVVPAMQVKFREAMKSVLTDQPRFDSMVGAYDSPEGEIRFREAVARLLRDTLGWQIETDNIAVTNGSQSSFFVLFNLFSGDYSLSPENKTRRHIMLPLTPEYIGYADAGLGESIFVSHRPHIERLDNNLFKYHVDLDSLEVDDSIGALCVSRPTNPTGNVLSDDEVDSLMQMARERDIPLILDCAYGSPFPNIVFTDAKPFWERGVILCLSLSKLGLPGVRTGIVVADNEVVRAISAANAILSLAPGSFGPTLITEAVESGDIIRWSNELVKPFYRAKVDAAVIALQQALAGLPFRIHQPEGAIFLWLWFEGLPITSKELYRRLKARGVFVLAGEHFFPGLEGSDWRHRYECIRVSYAGNADILNRGIDIIAEEIRAAYR